MSKNTKQKIDSFLQEMMEAVRSNEEKGEEITKLSVRIKELMKDQEDFPDQIKDLILKQFGTFDEETIEIIIDLVDKISNISHALDEMDPRPEYEAELAKFAKDHASNSSPQLEESNDDSAEKLSLQKELEEAKQKLQQYLEENIAKTACPVDSSDQQKVSIEDFLDPEDLNAPLTEADDEVSATGIMETP